MKKTEARRAILSAARSIVLSHRHEPGCCPTVAYEMGSDECFFCNSDTWKNGTLIHDNVCEWKMLSDAVWALEH